MKNKTSSYFAIQLAALGLLLVGVFFLTSSIFGAVKENKQKSQTVNSWWSIQSIDTMKYSRDVSREKMGDRTFDQTIDTQIKNIAATGATHVGIATPYDDEFVPMLKRWVTAARKHNLKVWFRGNFSGWEGWFDYKRIPREEHLRLTKTFITSNTQLFEDGDIFTPCPECENGGPGDPRLNGDANGHKQFLIDSYRVATESFRSIGKGIKVGYYSMNYDVAKLIMDPKTTAALGGIVTIDHYIRTPQQLNADITAIANSSGGRVYLGEFGAPIPDIHGDMSQLDQQNWIDQALRLIAENPHVVGVNYWVNVGGSTEVWNSDGTPKTSVESLTKYFTPKILHGTLVDQIHKPIRDVIVKTQYKNTTTSRSGQFIIPILPHEREIYIESSNHTDKTVQITDLEINPKTVIHRISLNLSERFLDYLYNLFSNLL